MVRPLTLHAYPALMLAGALAAGIAGAAALPEAPLAFWTGLVIAAAMLTAGCHFRARHHIVSFYPVLRTVLALVAVAGLGGLLYRDLVRIPPDHYIRYLPPETRVVLSGRVASLSAGGFILEVGEVNGVRVRGRLQVLLADKKPTVAQGDLVQVGGMPEVFSPQRNPGAFDYRRYMALRGVHRRLFVQDPDDVRRTGHREGRLERVVLATRKYLTSRIAQHTRDSKLRMIATTLIVGDRTELDPETRAHFVRTGLMHLLAISGLHVLIVGMILYELLRSFLVRLRLSWQAMEWTRTVVVVLVLALYAAVTGAPASVLRSVVMATLFMLSAPLQRPSHPMNSLGAAALFVLLVSPGQLFDVGFQLSFAAVAALVALYPVLRQALPTGWRRAPARYLTDACCMSVAATLGTAPILAYHFGQVPVAGVLLNLVAVPLSQVVLAAGLLTALPDFLGAASFGAIAEVMTGWMIAIAERGDVLLSWTLVHGRPGNGWFMVLLVLAPVVVAAWPLRRLRMTLVTACLLCAAGGFWSNVLRGEYRPALDAVFLDVGQGDAAYFAFPDGRRLLVDAGGRDAFSDRGERVVVPFLKSQGVRRLDAVVITHVHGDHLGGLEAVLQDVRVGEVITAAPLPPRISGLLAARGIPVRTACAGTRIMDGQILTLSPICGQLCGNVNDQSLVLRIEVGRMRFLLAGDAGVEIESELMARYPHLLQADVVKVAHHGSRTSSSPGFVRSVSNGHTLAVVSAGRMQARRFSTSGGVAHWRQAGAAVHVTAEEGAVWIRTDGRTARLVDWR